MLNTFTMVLAYDTQPIGYTNFLNDMGYIFLIIYFFEMVLKLIGLGWNGYIVDGWNKFDFFLVWAGIIGAFVNFPIISIFRLFRIARVFRAVRQFPKLLMLFKTLIVSIPAFMNVIIVLGL